MVLQSVIDSLNQVWNCGKFHVMDNSEAVEAGFSDIQPGDIVVHYNYWDDELSSSTDTDKLITWLYDDPSGGWTQVRSYLAKHGYIEVDEMDGSGSGLYYGATVFRKV